MSDDKIFKLREPTDNDLRFFVKDVEMLRISPEGFYVKGEFVEDKEKICQAMIDWFRTNFNFQ